MIDIMHGIIYSKDIPKLKLSLANHYEPKMVRFSPPPKHTKKEVNEINGYMFFPHIKRVLALKNQTKVLV